MKTIVHRIRMKGEAEPFATVTGTFEINSAPGQVTVDGDQERLEQILQQALGIRPDWRLLDGFTFQDPFSRVSALDVDTADDGDWEVVGL